MMIKEVDERGEEKTRRKEEENEEKKRRINSISFRCRDVFHETRAGKETCHFKPLLF